MARLAWDETGKRFYEMGVSKGVLYPFDSTASKYEKGVAWNGLISVSESPEGAEATDLWADDIKYASFRSAETFGGTIEAYTSPEEFDACDGTAEIIPGVSIGQQPRKMFGFSYRTSISSDTDSERSQYKLHIVHGATASPSEKNYETINDSPDAVTLSWEFTTTPVDIPDHKPTSLFILDSRKIDKDVLKKVEDILYGTETEEPRLPMASELIALLEGTSTPEADSVTE